MSGAPGKQTPRGGARPLRRAVPQDDGGQPGADRGRGVHAAAGGRPVRGTDTSARRRGRGARDSLPGRPVHACGGRACAEPALAERLRAVSPSDPRERAKLARARPPGGEPPALPHRATSARAAELLRAAAALAAGRRRRACASGVLLRCGEIELLNFDVGAALVHTSAALDLAREAGLRRRRGARLGQLRHGPRLGRPLPPGRRALGPRARASLEVADDARLRGNIWALRCPLGFRLARRRGGRGGRSLPAGARVRAARRRRAFATRWRARRCATGPRSTSSGAACDEALRAPRARGILSQPGRASALADRGAAGDGRGARAATSPAPARRSTPCCEPGPRPGHRLRDRDVRP